MSESDDEEMIAEEIENTVNPEKNPENPEKRVNFKPIKSFSFKRPDNFSNSSGPPAKVYI